MGNIACAHKASDKTQTVKNHPAYQRFNSHVQYHGRKKGNAKIMALLKVFVCLCLSLSLCLLCPGFSTSFNVVMVVKLKMVKVVKVVEGVDK